MNHSRNLKQMMLRIDERIEQLESELKEFGGANKFMRRILKLEEMHFMVKEILTFDETCIYLDFSKSQLYKLVHAHKIPFHKPSGRIFFMRKELIDWVQETSKKQEKIYD